MFKFETTAETMEELAEKLFRALGKVSPEPAPVAAPTPDVPVRAAPATPPIPAVPVAPTPGYTAELVGNAGADLIAADPGKMGQLLGLLGQFGVQAITELTPDKLGPFATALRGLGAKI